MALIDSNQQWASRVGDSGASSGVSCMVFSAVKYMIFMVCCAELFLLVRIYLTSTNVDNRSLGTKLLSEVLSQIDPNCLNPNEGWW